MEALKFSPCLNQAVLILGALMLRTLGPKVPVDPEAAVYHANRVPRLDCYNVNCLRDYGLGFIIWGFRVSGL